MPLQSSQRRSARMEHIDSYHTNVHEIYHFDVSTQIFQAISISVIVGQK